MPVTAAPKEGSVITLPLSRGIDTIIDDEDGDLVSRHWKIRGGYVCHHCTQNGRKGLCFIHRIILERIIGRILIKGEVVDHIDGNPLNNHRSNLRLASIKENVRNSKKPKNNTSGFKGVSWHDRAQKWRARIFVDRRQIHLGYFDTPEEAHKAYMEAAKELHGEFARFE